LSADQDEQICSLSKYLARMINIQYFTSGYFRYINISVIYSSPLDAESKLDNA
jgi:hypothetical protein